MAEERQDLLPDQPEPTVLGGAPGPRGISCSRGGMFSAVSVFAALLIAGQAATVYFVVQQHGQITKLKDFTTELKLKMLTEQLPKGHASPPKMMRMAMANMPLAFVDTDPEHPVKRVNLTKLENTAKTSSNIEDHVKYIIAKDNPQMIMPEFNDSLLENLKQLKDSMNYPEWKSFKSWMHQWLLFHSVQKPLEEEFDEDMAENTPITAAPVLSKCQLDASRPRSQLLGEYRPKCADNGEYLPKQCLPSTGFCWCVYKNGTEIPDTKTRARLDCSSIRDPEGSTLEPWLEDDILRA